MTLHAENTPVFRPNNRLDGRSVVPALAWNDDEILKQLAASAPSAPAAIPELGSTAHAKAVLDLFQRHDLAPPTYWAAVQWVRRKEIPDRWRSTVVYMLMRDRRLDVAKLFRRTPTSTPTPTTATAT